MSSLLARLVSIPRLAAVLLAVGVVGLCSLLVADSTQAATLRFNPSTLTIGLSETAELQLIASSTDKRIYSVEVTIDYPTELVLGIEANAKGTVFPLTVFPSTVDNTNGRAKFTVAVPEPGYMGNNGVVGTIVLRGQKLGTGQIKVVSAKVIHVNQGTGLESNVYTSATPANLVVDNSKTPQYTTPGTAGPVPIVNSPSHPDPSKWYPDRSVQFTWTGGGGGGYSWLFDQNPETLAPAVSRGSGTSTTIGGVGDGTWYMHVRAEADGVWGPTTTFRVQVDGSSPAGFQLEVDPDNTTNPSALPKISFEATDAHGGIDYYELSLDGSDPVKTRSPYQLPQLPAGEHTVEVWAVDKAGNRTRASVTLNLVPLSPSPVITSPDNGFNLTLGTDAKIRGTGPAGSTMQLYANGQYLMSVEVDDQGNFEFELTNQVDPGEHEFTVKAVKPNHLDSAFSDAIKGTLVGGGIIGGFGQDLSFGNFKVPFWVTIVIYILILLLLIFLLIYLYYRWRKARREQKLAMQKLELMTAPDPISTDVGQDNPSTSAIPPVPTAGDGT